MKIAVASTDGVSLSPHFGRSTCFIVFETDQGKVLSREVRDNTHTAFAKGECSGEHHEHGEEHSHAGVVNALRDCSARPVRRHGLARGGGIQGQRHPGAGG